MKEAVVCGGMKPTIVYAKAMGGDYSDWLVFISRVEQEDEHSFLHINCFFCMCLSDKHDTFFHEDGIQGWGHADQLYWRFYTPTEEQKKKVIEELVVRGYKYVSALNKLVKKT